ncbi:MAG TPA: hypothetical protein VKQ07_02155, partial [Jatrophihabitantaceae bacterium]|nr:hypothetical protein [Jatrophihabitantaceae bacterium]
MSELDEAVAREVAERFLAAPSSSSDPLAARAYAALATESDRTLQMLTEDGSPASVRVVFTRCREPYSSDLEMIDAVRSTRLLEITASR